MSIKLNIVQVDMQNAMIRALIGQMGEAVEVARKADCGACSGGACGTGQGCGCSGCGCGGKGCGCEGTYGGGNGGGNGSSGTEP
ncbi:MAG: hypothetical protein J0L51_06335 [Rhizobiales bacterium]|nr:hypothetical protein [Hyphomicrobiales bacterium]